MKQATADMTEALRHNFAGCQGKIYFKGMAPQFVPRGSVKPDGNGVVFLSKKWPAPKNCTVTHTQVVDAEGRAVSQKTPNFQRVAKGDTISVYWRCVIDYQFAADAC